MRTYERRISRDGKWEGEITRRHAFFSKHEYVVKLTAHAKRGTAVNELRTNTLTSARRTVRDWLDQ